MLKKKARRTRFRRRGWSCRRPGRRVDRERDRPHRRERGSHFILAYRLVEKVRHSRCARDRRQARGASRSGRRRPPHAVAIERALAAVAAVNETGDKMGSTGELKAFTFKEARKVDPAIRDFDYIHARKTAMLEALARERTQ